MTTFSVANLDAVTWLERLPAGSVSLAITDPPYESLEKHRAIGTTTRLKASKASSNEWFAIFPNSRFDELFTQLHRVLAKHSHLYLFCDPETMFVARPAGERAGFKFWKPLIWRKNSIGMGYHYRAKYEVILFFEKGKRKLADLGIADVLDGMRVHNGYPAEKPVSLSETFVKQSSSPGELVIDPFMGSGSVGVAAVMHRRAFAGNDLCREAVEITERRLVDVGGARVSEPVAMAATTGQTSLSLGRA
jgi:site-specific DNA-methyltransferase (adenine-specific)